MSVDKPTKSQHDDAFLVNVAVDIALGVPLTVMARNDEEAEAIVEEMMGDEKFVRDHFTPFFVNLMSVETEELAGQISGGWFDPVAESAPDGQSDPTFPSALTAPFVKAARESCADEDDMEEW